MRVFLTSPWIPAEWIRAHGLQARGIWAEARLAQNALPLSAGVCAFAEMLVRFADAHSDEVVIFSTTCDQLRRGFDVTTHHRTSRAFLFNVPATQTPAAKNLYRSELKRLGNFLVGLGGCTPTGERLRDEMLLAGRTRRHLLKSLPTCPPRQFAEAVARFDLNGPSTPGQLNSTEEEVPVALVGGPLSAPHWPLLDAIAAAGGRVALNATDTGERALSPVFNLSDAAQNPFDSLVSGYFENIVDVFHRPNSRLYSWLGPRLSSRNVRGIVLWHFTGCDLWRAEAETLREAFGLPVLPLEAGEAPGVSQRDFNRIEAFMETLR